MKTKILVGVFSLLVFGGAAPTVSAAYMVTQFGSAGLNAMGMASALLAGSSGVVINSATYTGANQASGIFTGGGSIFGIDQGVVLTSGSAQNFGSNNNGQPGYAPLEALNGNRPTFDASVLDIKFTPTGSFITFNYVFGSEEYPVFVDSQFNDVFGFFVNGTAPANNRALIPGTSTPVAINSINCGNASGAGAKPHCDQFIDNRNGDKGLAASQLGGWTKVFSFVASVNDGVENELILAIADTSDAILDSAALVKGLATCGGPEESPCPTPEPATLALFGLGIAALAFSRRKRAR
jgi:hypothetical protein